MTIKGKGKAFIRITNNSQLDLELVADGSPEKLRHPVNNAFRGQNVMLTVSGKTNVFRHRKNPHTLQS